MLTWGIVLQLIAPALKKRREKNPNLRQSDFPAPFSSLEAETSREMYYTATVIMGC